ncbi:hypothetical protein STEG23_022203, partial [Scotinomys teguina]
CYMLLTLPMKKLTDFTPRRCKPCVFQKPTLLLIQHLATNHQRVAHDSQPVCQNCQ